MVLLYEFLGFGGIGVCKDGFAYVCLKFQLFGAPLTGETPLNPNLGHRSNKDGSLCQ